jgi:hypothetical protein
VRRRSIALSLAVVCLCAPPSVAADADITPPVGSISVVHDDRANELIRFDVTATDDLSGVATVDVSGDGVTWASYAYAPQVDWSVFDPAAGGAPGLGNRTIRVRWTDGVGNTSVAVTTTLYLGSNGALEYPVPPVTGQPFTIRPIYPPGTSFGPDVQCSWELDWGSKSSLIEYNPDQTWGSLFLNGPTHRGFCGDWTFTLPWVPVPQFLIHFSTMAGGTGDDAWEVAPRFYPAAGSTDRRIHTSTIPLVQIVPDAYTMVVGQPITYRAYPIGVSLTSKDRWGVRDPNMVSYKLQTGGSKLTFTPNKPGAWIVYWQSGLAWTTNDLNFGATYDPKARYPDVTRPNTTAPVQRIGAGTLGTSMPVTLSWSGADRGWGIAKYQLQRSIDGGAWQGVSLSTYTTTSTTQQLGRGHRYQYRVRALDKAGNVGYWDYGAKFRPRLLSDASATYGWTWLVETDPSALDGSLHSSSHAGAFARFTFTGRDVAWVAEKGIGKGRAKVYVDGHLRTTVDLAATLDTPRQIVFRAHWTTVGSHVVKIVVEGTLGRPIVTVDGMAYLG